MTHEGYTTDVADSLVPGMNTRQIVFGNLILVAWLLLAIYLQHATETDVGAIKDHSRHKSNVAAVNGAPAGH